MIRADFQQGMESVFLFQMDAVTKNYRLIYAESNGNTTLSCVSTIFSRWLNLKRALRFHALLTETILSL